MVHAFAATPLICAKLESVPRVVRYRCATMRCLTQSSATARTASLSGRRTMRTVRAPHCNAAQSVLHIREGPSRKHRHVCMGGKCAPACLSCSEGGIMHEAVQA